MIEMISDTNLESRLNAFRNLKFKVHFKRHFNLRYLHDDFAWYEIIDEYKVPLKSPLKCHYMGITQLLTYFKVHLLFTFDICHM